MARGAAGGETLLRFAALAAAILAVGAGTVFAEAPSLSALCAGHTTCRLVKTTPAGLDAQGRHLGVVELDIGKEDDGGFRCRPYRREFWLSIPGVKPQRLFELCNDGYGAANVGEDRLAVGPNRLTHFQKGGSAWRYSVERIIALVPLRLASQEHCTYHNLSSGYTRTRWDWRNFKAEVAWRPPPCSDDDNPGDRVGCDARPATRAHTAIPQFDAAAAMAKPLHLGSCAYALRLPQSPEQLRARRPPAELRMLMISARDLIVTVADDELATGSADWRDDDHLELWLGPNVVGLACLADAKEPIRQWGISLADGKIHAGSGNLQEAPTLARFTARTIGNRREVTVHLVLPGDGKFTPGITLAYSKKEGVKSRVIATSEVKAGDATTLGSVWVVDSRGATCAEKDGRLDLTDTGLPAALEQ